ncbi:hypothetical protein O0L34_g11725 [Tuta absoluta]|nr:hypothetical protein O0L34_g11725 [Tuta absoluta]
MKDMFAIAEPKMVFCISERVKDVQNVLDELKLESNIVTMDVNSETQRNATSLNELLKKHGAKENIQNFRASDFDPEEKTAVLMPTSGTTDLPKQACLTHKNCVVSLAGFWCRETTFPTPFKTILIMAPMQWNTCVLHLNQAPVYRYTNVMSPLEIDKEHFYELVNKYKPNQLIISPTKLASYIEPGMKDKCDLSSIRLMMIGGSAASPELMKSVQEISPNIEIRNVLGQTEAAGNTFQWGATVLGSVGDPATHIQYRLIDVDTQKDIYERNKIGELWLKGPSVFKGYYKNPEASKAAFSEDGWFKTGDLLYRDNQNYFFFVDRIKQMFKYMNHQISPVEIQNVILQHPAVLDAVVTSIPDECGDLPVACVVRKPGSNVTAQEIKDLVKNSLSDSKQLRGGVIFMDKMLMAATTKVDIRELKKIVLESDRE